MLREIIALSTAMEFVGGQIGIQKEKDMAQAGAGADTAAEPREIEKIGHRIEGQNEQFINYSERLERLSDRIQGCIPRETEKINKTRETETPASHLASVHSNLDRLAAITDRLRSAIQRLEEL
jgi:hypothetical protein